MTLDAADVVVVGSGAFGASAAYHLARLGAHVAVLERAGLASQTSPRAAGLTSQVRARPALTRLARRAPPTPATGFELGPRGVEGVRTPRGTIATRAVVDAAGAWARLVAASLGTALPVVPTRHQLLITEPIPGVGPEFPIARVIDANVYVRHERGGLMLGGSEPGPVRVDMARLP